MEILDLNSSMMRAREEGIAQEKENIFLAFVKKGLSVKMMSDTIGLSKQELTAILKNILNCKDCVTKNSINIKKFIKFSCMLVS